MSEHRHKTWGEAAGLPETSIRLERLPPNLQFNDDYPEPIRYDAQRKRLVYRGFMTSVSYTYLRRRSGDPAYLEALDALFQESAYTHPSLRRKGQRWLWALGAAAAVGVAVVIRILMR